MAPYQNRYLQGQNSCEANSEMTSMYGLMRAPKVSRFALRVGEGSSLCVFVLQKMDSFAQCKWPDPGESQMLPSQRYRLCMATRFDNRGE
jgi:hypothetical protein